jgi:hypothetical protein
MTTTFRILAGIFSLVAGVLFKFNHVTPAVISTVFALCSLVAALIANNKEPKLKKHSKENRVLFMASLKIIEARTRITLDLINDFKNIFNENRHFISPDQEDTILDLISALGDVRINDAELADKSMPLESRPAMVTERRVFLDRVENMESTIDKYLRKIT